MSCSECGTSGVSGVCAACRRDERWEGAYANDEVGEPEGDD